MLQAIVAVRSERSCFGNPVLAIIQKTLTKFLLNTFCRTPLSKELL
jgi:hypothetical protein